MLCYGYLLFALSFLLYMEFATVENDPMSLSRVETRPAKPLGYTEMRGGGDWRHTKDAEERE